MIKEHVNNDYSLIFHAPLTSDVNDVINQIQGVNVDGTWDAYAADRGIKIVAQQYKSNVYWNISTLRALLLSATTILIRADVYLLNFVSAIPNTNNYTYFTITDTPTNYNSATAKQGILVASGNVSVTSFIANNTQNTLQYTYKDITDNSAILLNENLTRGTIIEGSNTLLRTRINSCNYLQFCSKVYSAGGTFSGYVKDLKIWVK